MASNSFYFQAYLGKISISTNIFQIDWNNQPEFQEIAHQKSLPVWEFYVYKATIPTCYKDVLQAKNMFLDDEQFWRLPVFGFAKTGGSPVLGVAFLSWNGIFPGIYCDSNKITKCFCWNSTCVSHKCKIRLTCLLGHFWKLFPWEILFTLFFRLFVGWKPEDPPSIMCLDARSQDRKIGDRHVHELGWMCWGWIFFYGFLP